MQKRKKFIVKKVSKIVGVDIPPEFPKIQILLSQIILRKDLDYLSKSC